jgi:hypothetical protein
MTKSMEVVKELCRLGNAGNGIKMDLNEIGYDCMNWINSSQDLKQWRALVNAVLNLRLR